MLSKPGQSHFFPVIPLLLSFFALWSWDLGYPSFTEDEAFVTRMAEKPVAEILRRLNTDEPHPPLFYLSMRTWRLLTNSHLEFLVRMPAVLLGAILLSLTYRLGRDLGLSRAGALAAAILLGLDPQITIHVREARMYGPMIASLACAALIGWRFPRLPRRLAVPLTTAASLLALFTHYFNVLFVVALGVWGALTFAGADRRRWIIAQAIALGALALWMPLMGRGFFNPTSLNQGKWWASVLPPWETFTRLSEVGMFGYRDYQYRMLAWAGGALLGGTWLIGAFAVRGRARWFLLTLVALPLAIYALVCWLRPVFHPKYTLPWLLFAALAVGVLVSRRIVLGLSLGLALIAVIALPTWRTLRMPYEPVLVIGYDDWQRPAARELARTLAGVMGPTDTFGLGTPDWAHCYYSNEYFSRSLGCALLPASPTQSVEALTGQIDQLLDEHRVLWYLDFYNPGWDPNHVADEALARRALSLGAEALAARRLRLYARPETILRQQQTVGARFGEAAELEGVWLIRGGEAHVVLVWRALADRPPVSAKVFVHLFDDTGQLLAQDDSIPVGWTRPLDTWQLGEQLLDVHILPLPAENGSVPSGSLRVGLYNPDTLARLPAYDAAGTRLPDDAATMPLSIWVTAGAAWARVK